MNCECTANLLGCRLYCESQFPSSTNSRPWKSATEKKRDEHGEGPDPKKMIRSDTWLVREWMLTASNSWNPKVNYHRKD